MLPDPTFTFTLPSILNNSDIECRIYNPPDSVLDSCAEQPPWHPRGAVIAHPYPPMGGCYDDWIVLAAVTETLKHGFVVGTFNFRGAGPSSKGSTTWTGKGELSDYISFAGFLMNYISNLHRVITSRSPTKRPSTPSSRVSTDPFDGYCPAMTLILGGYSYGSLITSHLPSTEDIQSRFRDAKKDTIETEIVLRAHTLAVQWNKNALTHIEAAAARDQAGKSPSTEDRLRASCRSMAIAVGGDETPSRRPSRDSKRSIDAVRRSVDRSVRKLGLRHHASAHEEVPAAEKTGLDHISVPKTHYLLISPLLPPISTLATFFSRPRLFNHMTSKQTNEDEEEKLVKNPALAVYGDGDFFTSVRKLRRWRERLTSREGSLFRGVEIAGAGHFWREEGVEARLREVVGTWVEQLAAGP